jgi:hypothetical protein
MTEDERRLFQSLETLSMAAHKRFDQRRNYEWKVSISIWTVLAIVIAGLMQPLKEGEFPLKGLSNLWIWVPSVALVVIHGFFAFRLARSNSFDKRESRYYENIMREWLAPELSGFRDEIQGIRDLDKKTTDILNRRKWWKEWVAITQILITLLLAGSVVLIIIVRS